MRNTKGFSMLELVVVFVMVAILALIAVPNYKKYRLRSKVASMYAQASAAQFAVTNDYFSQGSNLNNIDYTSGSQPFVTPQADFISSISITNGTITVTGNASNLNGNSIVLSIVPTVQNNEITWTCYIDSSFFAFAPEECQNAL